MVTRMLVIGLAAVALAACAADDEPAGTNAPAGQGATVEAQTVDGAPLGDTVSVVGLGEASGEPDVVLATVGVEVTDDSADRALETASARAADVIAALQEAGVAEEDIRTQEISVREEGDRPPPPESGEQAPVTAPEIVAVNVLEVRIRGVDEAGTVLSAVSDAAGDVTRIRSVRFEVSEPEPLLETAREEAFQDARSRAEQYASLADRELGALVSIREHGAEPGPSGPTRSEETDAAAVPVQPGTQDVTVQLTAVWSLD